MERMLGQEPELKDALDLDKTSGLHMASKAGRVSMSRRIWGMDRMRHLIIECFDIYRGRSSSRRLCAALSRQRVLLLYTGSERNGVVDLDKTSGLHMVSKA
jgi:hypothetical protein